MGFYLIKTLKKETLCIKIMIVCGIAGKVLGYPVRTASFSRTSSLAIPLSLLARHLENSCGDGLGWVVGSCLVVCLGSCLVGRLFGYLVVWLVVFCLDLFEVLAVSLSSPSLTLICVFRPEILWLFEVFVPLIIVFC